MIVLTDSILKEIKEKPYLVRLYMIHSKDPLAYMVMATSVSHAEAIVVTKSKSLKGTWFYDRVVAEEWNGRPFSFLDGYME